MTLSKNATVTRPPNYGIPSILALGFLGVLEAVVASDTLDVRFGAALSGLVLLFGCLQGAVLTAGLRWLPRLRPIGPFLSPAFALGFGLWLAHSLGVVSRLDSTYRQLAIATGIVCLAGGLTAAGLLYGLQAASDGRSGRLYRMRRGLRLALFLLLGFAGMLATLADHLLYVGLYPSAHGALRVASSVLFALSITLMFRFPALGRATPLCLLVGLGMPIVALTGPADDALQAFAQRPVASSMLESVRAVLDLDGDGFSPLLGGGDCNDRDRHINPTAAEVPNNGVDDNCFSGDATETLHAHVAESFEHPKTRSPLSVVLITIDTLRWDRLGLNDPAFGPDQLDTMPEISRWGAAGVNFRKAYSGGSWTSISLATLLRGRYARRLEWVAHYETNRFRMLRKGLRDTLHKNERITKMFPLAWHDSHQPVSQRLKERGMRTIAVIDDSFTLMLARSLGTASGFQIYRETNAGASMHTGRGDDFTATIAIQELKRAQAQKKPYFMWIHFFGPHGPSLSHEEVRKDDDTERGRYDHEVRYTDMQVGRVLEALQKDMDHTAVFITSDHGEEFGNNHRNHGMDLRESLIRVPLVARVPGWRAQNFEAPVTLVDLMPTILSLTETPAPKDLDGMDLGAWVTGKALPPRRVMLVDDWAYDRDGKPYIDLVGAFDGDHKLVLNRRNHSFSRFTQGTMEDQSSTRSDLLSGPLMRELMGYVESTGASLQLHD